MIRGFCAQDAIILLKNIIESTVGVLNPDTYAKHIKKLASRNIHKKLKIIQSLNVILKK